MEIRNAQQVNDILVIALGGELDAAWAEVAERELGIYLEQGQARLVLDLAALSYLSSAGLRVLVRLHQRSTNLGGGLFLAAAQPFVRGVLITSGLDRALPLFDKVDQALTAATPQTASTIDLWAGAETSAEEIGTFQFRSGHPEPVDLRVVGQADNFLYSQLDMDKLASFKLEDMGYTWGIGALGALEPVVLERLGELLIVPGAVYWWPGDGRQIPDFLTWDTEPTPPQRSSPRPPDLPLHLAYGLRLSGPCQVYGRFKAADTESGTSLDDLIRGLVTWADGQSGYTGLTGLVLRADVAGLWGVGLKRSPRREQAPANEQRISHRENIRDWLHFFTEPAYVNHTLLAVGVFAEQGRARLSDELFRNLFGMRGQAEYLRSGIELEVAAHLHGAVFGFVPEQGQGNELETEIRHVVQRGELANVLHLLPTSRLRSCLFGLWWIGNIEGGN